VVGSSGYIIATDLGMGQPVETARCSCVVAVHLDDDTPRDIF
jgi:hypothetical protein